MLVSSSQFYMFSIQQTPFLSEYAHVLFIFRMGINQYSVILLPQHVWVLQYHMHLSIRMRLSLNQTDRQSVSAMKYLTVSAYHLAPPPLNVVAVINLSIICSSPFLFFHGGNVVLSFTLFHCFFNFTNVPLKAAQTNSHRMLLLQGMTEEVCYFCTQCLAASFSLPFILFSLYFSFLKSFLNLYFLTLPFFFSILLSFSRYPTLLTPHSYHTNPLLFFCPLSTGRVFDR